MLLYHHFFSSFHIVINSKQPYYNYSRCKRMCCMCFICSTQNFQGKHTPDIVWYCEKYIFFKTGLIMQHSGSHKILIINKSWCYDNLLRRKRTPTKQLRLSLVRRVPSDNLPQFCLCPAGSLGRGPQWSSYTGWHSHASLSALDWGPSLAAISPLLS